MFARLANFVSRHWLAVLLVWVALPIGLAFVSPTWDDITRDGDFAYLPARLTSVRGEQLVGEAFPNLSAKSQVVLVVARPGGKLGEEDFDVARRLAEKFTPKEGDGSPVASILTHDEPVVGQKLIHGGANGQAVLVIIQLANEFMAINNIDFVKRVEQTIETMQHAPDLPPGLTLGMTGSAAIGSDMLLAADESIHNTEWTTILLVVVILLFVYRAPGLVIVPLLAIAVSFIVSVQLIALVAQCSDVTGWFNFQVFKTTKIFIIVMLFGAATDYCLFLIARYREELERGLAPREAIHEALSQTGHALTGQRHDHHPRPGGDDLRRLRQVSLGRSDDRPVAGRGPGGLSHGGPGPAAGHRPARLLAVRRRGQDRRPASRGRLPIGPRGAPA